VSPASGKLPECQASSLPQASRFVALNVNSNAAAVARVGDAAVALADRQEAFEGGLADAMARPRFVPTR
jgi:hypothetical protein